LAHTKRVCLISDPKADKLDKYGRLLAYIFSEQGTDINAELLKLGFASGYYYFPFSRKTEFRRYEESAKTLKSGVWSQ
jgi:micrococcal nuclease